MKINMTISAMATMKSYESKVLLEVLAFVIVRGIYILFFEKDEGKQ